jgi:hypothetical protein
MLTDTVPKGGYAPTLFTMLHAAFGEDIYFYVVG